jgi:hypothetical protein
MANINEEMLHINSHQGNANQNYNERGDKDGR